MRILWSLFDHITSWQFLFSFAIFAVLAVYSSWLYAIVLKEVDELRVDITRIAEHLGVDLSSEPEPEPETEELPAVEPTTVEAEAADTFARKEVVLARHRMEAGGRSVKDILAEAGLEPVKRRRW